MNKRWFLASKTFWFNLLVLLAGLGDVMHPYLATVSAWLGPNGFAGLMMFVSLANHLLRQLTAGGLSLTKPEE